MHLADVGLGVWVGSAEACDARGREFDRVVHVWKRENVDEGVACRHVTGMTGSGLAVEWTEGQPVEGMRPGLDLVADYLAAPGRLLIHCRAGVCRSATLAVLALGLRGQPLFCGFASVYEALWRQSRVTFTPHSTMVESLFRWLEARAGQGVAGVASRNAGRGV